MIFVWGRLNYSYSEKKMPNNKKLRIMVFLYLSIFILPLLSNYYYYMYGWSREAEFRLVSKVEFPFLLLILYIYIWFWGGGSAKISLIIHILGNFPPCWRLLCVSVVCKRKLLQTQHTKTCLSKLKRKNETKARHY